MNDPTLDALGRRRSSRSMATGRGSRGGGPSLDPKYWRDWRGDHPEYRAREARRKAAARDAIRARVGGDVTFTEVCREVVREEVAAHGLRASARALGLDHAVVWRWLHEQHDTVTSNVIDLVVIVYTMKRVLDVKARLRRERRAARLAIASGRHASPLNRPG